MINPPIETKRELVTMAALQLAQKQIDPRTQLDPARTTEEFFERALVGLMAPYMGPTSGGVADIPDEVVESAWSFYLAAGGSPEGLFELPVASPDFELVFAPGQTADFGKLQLGEHEIEGLLRLLCASDNNEAVQSSGAPGQEVPSRLDAVLRAIQAAMVGTEGAGDDVILVIDMDKLPRPGDGQG